LFDYSLTHWITFFTATVLLNISPGPDMAFIFGQTVKKGIKSGFQAMFGIWSGTFIHIIFATIGLSAILVSSSLAFNTLKFLGAFYLIWLGIGAIRTKHIDFDINKKQSLSKKNNIFFQGFLVSLLNPKVTIFFFSFLPQFIEIDKGNTNFQFFLHGFLVIIVAAFIEPPLILLSSKLTGLLNNNKKISLWIERVFGTVLITLGIKLATSSLED